MQGLRRSRSGIRSPKEIFLEAQTYAMGFYAREGFVKASEEFLEDGIPHTAMRLHLEE